MVQEWLLESLNMLLVCFLNGNFSPSCSILTFLGERAHFLAQLAFIKMLKACLIAEVLLGSGFLRVWGRFRVVLFLANWSAFSLPGTLLWLEIHLIERLHVVVLIARISDCMRCCPEVALGVLIARISAWLSMYSDTFFPIVSRVLSMIQRARMAPAISAS